MVVRTIGPAGLRSGIATITAVLVMGIERFEPAQGGALFGYVDRSRPCCASVQAYEVTIEDRERCGLIR